MKNLIQAISQKIEHTLLNREDWMFLALLIGGAIIPTNAFAPHGWGQYFSYFLLLSLFFSPCLLFASKKKYLSEKLSSSVFYVLWILVFGLYPLLLAIFVQEYQPFPAGLRFNEEDFYIISTLFFVLALSLEFNQVFQERIKMSRWIKGVSLGKVFFVAVIGIVLFITFYSISNLDTLYEQQVVELSSDFPQVLRNIPAFLGIGVQFLLLYLAAYLFYHINHHILIGKLLKRKGIIHYVMGVLATLVVLYPLFAQLIMWLPLHQKIQILAPSENMLPFDYINGLASFIIILVSLPVILVYQWFQQNNQILSLEKQQVQTELDLLKQQINPHFFFNTLNNLYGLSQKQSEQTPEVILQLSELMRYVIYKGKEQRVKLKEEINYLEDYNSLQQIRLHKKLDYRFEMDIEDYELEIPPLLLVVLVENAYKHGIEPAEHQAFLHMDLKSAKGKVMFTCENSVEGKAIPSGGLGIENLQRRLDLLFGTSYTLNLEAEDAIFKVHLSWQM